MKVLVGEGQSIWDVCIQHTGSIESVFSILNENNKKDSDLITGEELFISKKINKKVAQFFNDNKLVPASIVKIKLEDQYITPEYWQNNYTE
jgi:hypothetical protein